MSEQSLGELALNYAARFATSRAKLKSYLARKMRERGWEGEREPDLAALVARLAAQGFVDDRTYAETKASSLLRRGYGARRIRHSLDGAGIVEDDRTGAMASAEQGALAAALHYARRRRIGPYGDGRADPAQKEKALAAMLRAGHSFSLAKRVLAAAPGEVLEEE